MTKSKPLKSISLLLSSQIVTMIANLLLQVVIARLLLPEGRGVYAICIMFASLMTVLTYFGNEFGIRYLLVRGKINIQQSFKYLLITSSAAFLFSLLLFFPFKSFEVGFLGKASDWQFILSLVFAPTLVIAIQINVFLTITQQFKNAASITVIFEILKLLFVSIALFYRPSVEMALFSSIVANILITIYYVLRFNLLNNTRHSIKLKQLKYIYLYGAKSFFLTFNNFASFHVATLILSFYLSTEKIGIYSIAFALVSKVQVIPDALNRVLVPLTVLEKSSIKRKKIVVMGVYSMFILCSLIMFVLILFGEYIINIIFGSEYKDATVLIQILFAGFAFKMLTKPVEAYFNEIVGQPLTVARVHALSIILLVIFLNIGISFYGLVGASIANSLTMFTGFCLIFYYFIKGVDAGEKNLLSPYALVHLLKRQLSTILRK